MRRGLALLLGLYLLLAAGFNLLVPAFEMPDEQAHFFFAQHLARSGALPVQTDDPDTRGPWEQEGSQPPLFYALAAPLLRLAGSDLEAADLWVNPQNSMGHPAVRGNENRFVHPPEREGWPWRGPVLAVRLGRGLSTLFGALAVLGVALVARRVFRGRSGLGLAAAALVALNPQFLAVAAAFSNDMLVVALATWALWLLLRIADGHADGRTLAALALVSALAPLTKLSGLALLGFVLLSLAGLAWRRRDARLFLRAGGAVLLATLLVAGWWYARNLALYGDLTGLSHMLPGNTGRGFRLERWLQGLPAELLGLWWSTWGIFGWFTILWPTWLYHLLSAAALAAVLGIALAARRRADWIDWPRLAWLGAWALVVAASLLRWMMLAKGGHGRLLFPAIASLAVALVAGWRALLESAAKRRAGPPDPAADRPGPGPAPARLDCAPARLDRALALGIAVAMALLSVYSLVGVIRPAYAWPARIEAGALPAGARPVDRRFGEGLRLAAIEHPERVTEGETFPVTLYWQVERTLDREGLVALRLDQPLLEPPRPESPDDREGGYTETLVPGRPQLAYPGAGAAPPRLLEAGPGLYVDRRMVVADDLASLVDEAGQAPIRAPVLARLAVQLYDPETGTPWPVRAGGDARGAGGDAAEQSEWSSEIVVEPRPRPGSMVGDETLLARFDGGLGMSPLQALSIAGFGPALEQGARPLARCEPLEPGQVEALPVLWTYHAGLWQGSEPIEPLSAFVHLVDGSGAPIAQFDGPPATYGRFPTSAWREGERVPARLTWWWPAGMPRPAALRVGLYRPSDGARVPAVGPDAAPWPDHAVTVLDFDLPCRPPD